MERARVLARGDKFALEQDEDVLDTWFSSGLWPFSILGWPANTPDFQMFYPSTILETGWDILFFWVARMVMLGIKLTGRVPFPEVYCHAMIRDAEGRKMSKSKGNVIDPIDVMQGITLEDLHAKLLEGNLDEKEIKKAREGQKKSFPKGIPQCGTDALRFALCAYSGGGRDINLEVLRVEGYRKFCNKVFNATKFAMLKFDEEFIPRPQATPSGQESLLEQWILHKLNIAATEINKYLAERNFMSATTSAYNFWLYELCDVYIEAMKPMTDEAAPKDVRKSAQQTLYTCLDYGLRLLHPFMPYVTEELWQRLPRRPNDSTPSIMVSSYPVADSNFAFDDASQQFNLVFTAVTTGRSLAASYNLQSNIQLYLHIQSQEEAEVFESQLSTIRTLIKGCKSVQVARLSKEIPAGCGGQVLTPTIAVHTLVLGLVDLQAEVAKCDKKLDLARLNLQKIVKVESQLNYESSMPANVLLANAEKREILKAEISTLESSKDIDLSPCCGRGAELKPCRGERKRYGPNALTGDFAYRIICRHVAHAFSLAPVYQHRFLRAASGIDRRQQIYTLPQHSWNSEYTLTGSVTCYVTDSVVLFRPDDIAINIVPNKFIVEFEDSTDIVGEPALDSHLIHDSVYKLLEEQNIAYVVEKEYNSQGLFVGAAMTLANPNASFLVSTYN
ncbi:Valine--tRNA ligase, mitochondrial [Grifola frondosa]|uniref:valine--tRNA ligase n=1 Tax=Grifola frondosa TaxID=5627 RepID=A0A1C7M119_GRIFR|nr:Valine--tRNA ligase, mitochondrial [Grifola frondosa]